MDIDADLDLFVGNDAAQDRLFVGDGAGVVADAPGPLSPDGDFTSSVAAGDVDVDGRVDLFVGNQFGAATRLYVGIGAGLFTDAPGQLPANNGPTGDMELLDGDGDTDRLYVNRTRQLS